MSISTEGPSIPGLVPRAVDLRIGIVDLMSGSAGDMAKRQFSGMISSAARGVGLSVRVVEMSLASDGLSRSLEDCGIPWQEMAELDAMIVTGAEPKSDEIKSDPMLPVVERIIETSSASVTSTVFSCLAAHAALRILCSIDRIMLPEKQICFYPHRLSDPDHLLVAGVASDISVPHSRWNRISRARLGAEGVTTVMELSTDDWHMASSSDGLTYIFFQGHPEYEADTLFREYRRDVRRFLTGITDRYPTIPVGYFDGPSVECLTEFRELAERSADPAVLDFFPTDDIVIRPRRCWDETARTVAQNWLTAVAKERIGKS